MSLRKCVSSWLGPKWKDMVYLDGHRGSYGYSPGLDGPEWECDDDCAKCLREASASDRTEPTDG